MGNASAKAETAKTTVAQDKTRDDVRPSVDAPGWQTPNGMLTPGVGNRAIGGLLRNALPKMPGISYISEPLQGTNRAVSEALKSEGQPLDAQTRSVLETAFARIRVAPVSSDSTQQFNAAGHPVAAPGASAERVAGRVSGQVADTSLADDLVGRDLDGEQRPDFAHVRVHTDATSGRAANSLEANAFTLGSHIFFGPGRFDTSSSKGRRLLAHELTHVLQSPHSSSGGQRLGEGLMVFRQSWTDDAAKWYHDKKWTAYRAMISGLKAVKNANVAAMRGLASKAPASVQSMAGTVIDVIDFVIDMVIALLLVIVGLAVGFAEGIVGLVTGIIKLGYGLLKLTADFLVAVLGKPDAYTQDVKAITAAVKGIPAGLKKAIDNWVERYNKATLEEQVLMGGELIGQIEAFIATFAVAGTKAGQAGSLTVRAPAAVEALNVSAKGAAALQPAEAVAVTIPKIIPKTAAEGAVVASQMASMGGAGGGGEHGDSSKEATKPSAQAENGPYKDIKDGTRVEPGREFTATQKRKIISANRQRNSGRLKSDDPLDPYQDLSDPVKSVSPGMGGQPQDPAMAAIDHIVSRAAGGTNSYGNARVISQHYNNLLRAKGAKVSAGAK